MPTPILSQEVFSTATQGNAVLYKVGEGKTTVAVTMPAAHTPNPDRWYVCMFDPFGGPTAGGLTDNEDAAHDLAALFARTAAKAMAR